MIESIYYSIGILVFFSVLSTILKFGRIYSIKEWREKYQKVIGRVPIKREYRTKKEYSISESNKILSAFELIWIFFGFFSNSWYVFLLLVTFSYFLNFLLKPLKWTILYKISIFSFLVSKLILYLYLIINHFFLHIETYSFFIKKIL
jgi:hypothetical protein